MSGITTCFSNLLNVIITFVPGTILYITIPFVGVYALLRYFRR